MEYLVAVRIQGVVTLFSFTTKKDQKAYVKELKKRKMDYVFTKDIK